MAICALAFFDAEAAASQLELPAECGSQAEFDREVRRRLTAGSEPPAARVLITKAAEGFRLSMQVGEERRELFDGDCRELFRAAVIVAVAASRTSRARGERPQPSAVRHDTRTPSGEAAPPRAPSVAFPHPAFALGGGINLGLTPSAVLAFELEGQARWSQLGLAFGVRYLLPGSAQDAQRHGVTIRALGGHVAGLFRPAPLWEARLGVAAYRLSGSGLGSRADRDDTAWAAGPVAGIALHPLVNGRTWLAVAAELQLDLVQSRFEILDYDEVFRVSRVGGSFFLRVGHSFL